MTYSNCDAALTLIGPLFIIIGSFVACVGVLAWVKPNSSIVETFVMSRYPTEEEAGPILSDLGFTREGLGGLHMLMFRLLGPLIGAVFAVVGLWVTISQIHCGLPLPSVGGLIGPLQFRPWLPDLGYIIFAGFIGVLSAFRTPSPFRELTVILAICFGFAGSQAASFHTGIQAERWFAIGMLCALLATATWLAARATLKRQPS